MSKLEFVGTKIPSEWVQKLKQLTRLSKVNQAKPIATKIKPISPPTPPLDGAMRTGELFLALQQKGYTRSSSSLLKALNKAIASGVVPDELAKFGVICDFELKKLSNPLSGKVRWLFLN